MGDNYFYSVKIGALGAKRSAIARSGLGRWTAKESDTVFDFLRPKMAPFVLFIRASPRPAPPRIRVGGDALTAGAARLTTSLVAWEAALRHPRSSGVGRMPAA